MARTPRSPTSVTLPRIEPDEPRQLKLSLPGRLSAELEAYRRAYKTAYGSEVELEQLIPHILETFIRSDRSFKAWRATEAGGISDAGEVG